MLDVSILTENIDLLIQGLKKRNLDISLANDLKESAHKRKKALHKIEQLKAFKNKINQEIAVAKKSGENAVSSIKEMKKLSEQIKMLDGQLLQIEESFKNLAYSIPNIPHASVPYGSSSNDNVVIKEWGEKRKFTFKPLSHVELGTRLEMLDLKQAAKMAGARFSILKDLGAKLERALINFMLDVHTKENGYIEISPPLLVNSETLVGTGQLPKFQQDLFKLDNHDNFLIPTAEVPVTNILRDEILDEKDLPIKYVACTPCFRSEAGSYGKDTKGLIRQHQFYKVELVKFSHPKSSYEDHNDLLLDAEKILQRLELPYRVVLLCGGDMCFGAAKCYDIEVWVPSQNTYREISSCSNFEDFQARRINIKFHHSNKQKPQFIHTINGSGLAVGRTWLSIIENNQQEDGSIIVPKCLVPYLGVEKISI